jgi:hypothetical protein
MQLVQGSWWVTFGRLIVAYLIYIFWTAIVGSIGGAIGHGLTNVTVYEIVRGLANAVGFVLAYPFITAVINLIYLDLRVRKEGISDADFLERPRDPGYTVEAQAPPAEQAGMPSPRPEPATDEPPPGDEPAPGGPVTRY